LGRLVSSSSRISAGDPLPLRLCVNFFQQPDLCGRSTSAPVKAIE
jgi:hypothetical protein